MFQSKTTQLADAVEKLIDAARDTGTVRGDVTIDNITGILYEKRIRRDGTRVHNKPYTVFVPYDNKHRTAQAVYDEIAGYWFFSQ